MSLTTQISAVVTRIGTEFKTVYSQQGTLGSLSTTAKGSLVAAINEVNAKPTSSGGAAINDTAASTTTVYSSSKVESYVTTAVGAKPSINDSAASSGSVYSSSKTDSQIAAAISNRPIINDSTASATTVYSANKTNAAIAAAVSGVVNGAGAALDTLKELADALGNDANYAATTAAALNKRISVSAAQTFTAGELTQGRANLGVTSSADIGDVNTDFVAAFNLAIA